MQGPRSSPPQMYAIARWPEATRASLVKDVSFSALNATEATVREQSNPLPIYERPWV